MFRALERIAHGRLTALIRAHVSVNINDSEGLRNHDMKFCVQVSSADIEFHELIYDLSKLGVLYCNMTEGNLKTAFQREDFTILPL